MEITTQRTSKPLTAQLLLSASLFWFALLSWLLPYGGSMSRSKGVEGNLPKFSVMVKGL
jgi:hypothetical protein